MTIEGAPWFTVDGDVTLSRLPRPGWVLVSAETPPRIPGGRCVDVRHGTAATFDGDRLRMPIVVDDGSGRRRVDRRDLPDLEAEVRAALRGEEAVAVRFGDRAVCQQVLPGAAVDAIERRLRSAARHTRATLVTWTGDVPRNQDYRTYDVVIEGSAVHFG